MIVDAFIFFNELDLLELRLRELDDLIDHFVLAQGEETFAGNPKPMYFDPLEARWSPWRNRISVVTVPRLARVNSRWEREAYARNTLASSMGRFLPTDDVIFSDVDEIPDKQRIRELRSQVTHDHWVGFMPPYFYYFLNLRTPQVVGANALLKVSTLQSYGGQGIRSRQHTAPTMVQAGWHFSYLGGIEAIRAKLGAFSHAEYDTPFWKDPTRIARAIAAKDDLFDRKFGDFWVVDLAELPDEVSNNPDRYEHLILERVLA